jgi:uncharacterized protein YciI
MEYLYLIRPVRPGWIDGLTPEEETILEAHFQYLEGKLQEGVLLLAGPCLDRAFGIVLLRAGSLSEAEAIMRQDPAVAGGVMTAEMHPFRISLQRFLPEAPC